MRDGDGDGIVCEAGDGGAANGGTARQGPASLTRGSSALQRGRHFRRLQESLRVVPMHPLKGGELDVLETTPGLASTDHLGLVEADETWDALARQLRRCRLG